MELIMLSGIVTGGLVEWRGFRSLIAKYKSLEKVTVVATEIY